MKKILLAVVLMVSGLSAKDCVLSNESFYDKDGNIILSIIKACFSGQTFLIDGNTIVQIFGAECSCEQKEESAKNN